MPAELTERMSSCETERRYLVMSTKPERSIIFLLFHFMCWLDLLQVSLAAKTGEGITARVVFVPHFSRESHFLLFSHFCHERDLLQVHVLAEFVSIFQNTTLTN